MPPVLRDWSFKGSVDACGFLFRSRTTMTAPVESRIRSRILDAWRPGTTLYALANAHLLVFPEAERLRAETAPAAVVCRWKQILTTVPLEAAAGAALAPPPGALVTLQGGRPIIVPPHAWTPVNPADWLALTDCPVVVLDDLGPVPTVAQAAVRVETGDVRSALGGAIPPQDPRTAKLLAASPPAPQGTVPALQPWRTARPRRSSGATWLRALGRWFGAWPQGPGAGPGGRDDGRGPHTHSRNLPTGGGQGRSGPSWFDRLVGTFAHAAARADLANLIGRRQARYLMDTLRLFEQNRIEEALKRAISIGFKGNPTGRPALGIPSVRDSLRIGGRTPGQVFAMRLPSDVYQLFERTYRDQVTKLEAAGHFEQAAFILAELLEKAEEAVALLERAGRLAEAARVAEVRNLPAERAIRLWFLAGERDRAVRLAIRHNAFQDTVARLQPDHPEAAATLTALWARHLALSGDLRAAIWTALPRPELRDQVHTWIDHMLASGRAADGGETAAELLALKLRMSPEAWPGSAPDIDALLAVSGAEGRRSRCRFVQTMLDTEAGTNQPLALRPVVRRLLGETHGLGKPALDAVAKAITQSGDSALETDAEGLLKDTAKQRTGAKPQLKGPQETILIPAGDRGPRALHDAAVLPGGRALVALGEGGVLLCGPGGRVQTRFGCPAHRLVISDSGSRAIALANRGAHWRISRIDLVTRTLQNWTEGPLQGFADSYDGARWLVVQNGALLAVDCSRQDFQYLWNVPNIDGDVVALNRDAHRACFVLRQTHSVEIWSIALKSLALEVWEPKRDAIPAAADWLAVAVSPSRFVCSVGANREAWDPDWGPPPPGGTQTNVIPMTKQQIWRYRSEEDRHRLQRSDRMTAQPLRPLTDPAAWVIGGKLQAAAGTTCYATTGMREQPPPGTASQSQASPDSVDVDLDIYRTTPIQRIGRYRIEGVRWSNLRFQGDILCYSDDRGRVLALRADENEEVINWRL